MATKRDYGTFSKAAPRLLTPLAAQLGYKQLSGTTYSRNRQNWTEGFFLQASGYGSGDFCVNIGISVPQLDGLWQCETDSDALSLLIGERLTPTSMGEHWFAASDLSELQSSVQEVAGALLLAEKWFTDIKSIADIANLYRSKNNVSMQEEEDCHLYVLPNANYGLLLLLAGEKLEAREWLSWSLAQLEGEVAENEVGFSRRKPGKEALGYHEIALRQMNAVRVALRNAV
jgi:Domain of unknown function (DUF4304)